MFKVGDTVKYGGNGICKITDIITRDFCGEATEYYVLQTVTGFDSIIYVPVNNELLCNKMQYLFSKEDAIKVIKDIPDHQELSLDIRILRIQVYCQSSRQITEMAHKRLNGFSLSISEISICILNLLKV